ncbi:MAG: M23 family metallopeptidase [Chitinophagaceae bacterium]|nr:M23 family metallopeptidase [Chitinophagaceae bacterium]MCW5929696.1 M23 family metallopeptidase [Chitinophagaceae bacterium]
MRYFFSLLLLISLKSFTQSTQQNSYPQGYFRNPLNIAPSLSGNFGELRPNHYHMGLDFKTNRVENLPVYAAAEGFVARIKVEPFGFGRAVYIKHPNGFVSLYAHLNTFFPELEVYVTEQQYARESWAVDLTIPENMFPVKKGDFIANSGNSGGSMGPHLHFEIRSSDYELNLNPMLFGLGIRDNVPPTIQRLAIYDRTKSIYEQSPRIIAVKKTPQGYVTTPAIITVSSPAVSFAVTSYDTHSGSANLNGIFAGMLSQNGKEVIKFVMDSIPYSATRYMNAHIDYKTKSGGGPYLQHLSELPGYTESIYKKINGDGVLDLKNGQPRDITIETKDADGNKALLKFKIQFKAPATVAAGAPGQMFYPGMLNVGDGSEEGEFYISEKGLYDSVRINYSTRVSLMQQVVSAIHTIGNPDIPLQEGLTVRIKAMTGVPEDKLQRTVMQRFAGNKKEVVKPEWQQGWATARFREFGSFQLVLDETPPEIIPVGFNDSADLSAAKRIVITVKDNLDRVKNFRAELNGEWLRFTNDKGRNFIYTFDERCPAGENELKVQVEDEAGNISVKTFIFNR